MSDSDLKRRKLLLGLGGGIAGAAQLPAKWTKPVVDSVMLPAHAQTSGTTPMPTTTPLTPCNLVIPGVGANLTARVNNASYTINTSQCAFVEDGADVVLSAFALGSASASVTLGTNARIELDALPSASMSTVSNNESYFEQFVAADGGRWQASFSMSVMATSGAAQASVSSIMLTRLSI